MEKEKSLYEQLLEYNNKGMARFHMPGHKGKGFDVLLNAGIDVTELPDTDDLYDPIGILKSAQSRAAAAFGAQNTLFLVNGATAGINAMLLSLGEGAQVLMGRDCHKSAVSGAVLAGLDVDFIMPMHDDEYNMYGVIGAESVETALKARPRKAVFVTSPNYLGFCADIEAIADAAHRYGAQLLVDASHGSHFPFSKLLPQSPDGFADMWVHSAHKTLNTLGQSALLHIGTGAAAKLAEVRCALALVQTSSPSYLLMAALDNAVACALKTGIWDAQAARAAYWREQIGKLKGISVLGRELIGISGIKDMDVTRICIDVSGRGLSGYDAAKLLNSNGVAVEMADSSKLVLITAPPDEAIWYDKLYTALNALPINHGAINYKHEPLTAHKAVMSIRSAALSHGSWVKLEQANGMICGQAAGIYPPGIAEFMPGELIDETGITRISNNTELGAKTFGMENGCLYCIERRVHV